MRVFPIFILLLAGCPPFIFPAEHRDNVDGVVGDTGPGDTGEPVGTYDEWPDAGQDAGFFGEIAVTTPLGGYWTDDTPFGYARFMAIEPQDVDFTDGFAPGIANCAVDYRGDDLVVLGLGLNEILVAPEDGEPVALTRRPGNFFDGEFSAELYAPGQQWDLLQTDGGTYGPFAIDGLAIMPSDFDLYAPDFDQTDIPVLGADDLGFSWSDTDADSMMLVITHMDATQSRVRQTVSCLVANDGEFSLDPSVWAVDWEAGDVFVVTLGALEGGDGRLPNGARGAVRGIWSVNGAFAAAGPIDPDLDADSDGFPVGEDCNDDDPTVKPGATELCDGQLNDCDGALPDTEVDDDLDGRVECTIDAGGWDGPSSVLGGDDCDDSEITVYPGAPELCDGLDNDCAIGGADPGGTASIERADGTWADMSPLFESATPSHLAEAGAVVWLCDVSTTTQLLVDAGVEIRGRTGAEGNVFDGDGSHPPIVLDVGADAVTLSGLTIQNGAGGAAQGGGVHIDSAGLVTIDGVVFSNNQASFGGAIQALDGDIILSGSSVWANQAEQAGAGIYVGADAGLTVLGCDFGDDGDSNDNVPDDVAVDAGAAYEASSNATFACTATDCSGIPEITTGGGGTSCLDTAADPLDCALTNVLAGQSAHTCQVLPDHSIRCWGADDWGQSSGPQEDPLANFVQVDVGSDHTCAVREDNTITCWGRDIDQSVSLPNAAADTDFVQVATSVFATCALHQAGNVTCWGREAYGMLDAIASDSLGNFVHIGMLWNNICGVRKTGALQCYGRDEAGQTSQPNADGGTDFVHVEPGVFGTCALRSDKSVTCWGHTILVDDWSADPGGTDYVQVSMGQNHACALHEDGTLSCWGNDTYGQASGPEADNGGDIVFVAAGIAHTCALRDDDSVTCWGYDVEGQATSQAAP